MYAVKLSGMLPANYPLSEGSGIQQTFAIQAGHTYCISYKAKTDINNQYVCVRGTPVIQFRASNGALLTHTGGMPMGVAQNITSGTWATYNQSFTAPANFNTVSITAHSLNSIGYRSAYIDNICIKECNPCSPISIKNLASKLDGITFIAENSSHTSMSYNYKVVDDMGTEFAIGQIANLHPNEAATIEVAGLLPSKDYVLHAWPICDYAASNPTAFSTLNPDITISDNTTDTACLNATETDAFGTTTSDIKDANGRIIATVIPDAFTDLGTINVEVHNQNRPIVIDNQSFLGRTFNVTSNEIAGLIPNGGGYTMRLYFLDSELFTENGAAITPQNLGIKWWSGGSQTECLINDYINTPSSAGSFPVAGNIPSNQVNEGEFGRHNNGFYLQFHANHFTMFGASPDYTGLLPVKWLSFTGRVSSAKCAEKGSILLNWATASEQNVRDFTVERQAQKETSYKKIATQPAKNDENGAAYSFTDENLRSGTYNYRIKETDIDGTNDYTQIVSVLVNTCNHTAVYPNPTTAILELKTDGDRETPVTVFDINGRIIKEYTSIPESIDLATYPAGVYSLRIGEQVIKIVKL
jgi:hypothetical protein